MSVVVTGGAGFIGSNLCNTLLSSGEKVVAIDNLITSSKTNIDLLSKNPKFIFINHDITSPFSKADLKIIGKVSMIYHLACPTGVSNLFLLAKQMLQTCSIGIENVIELASDHKAKVVFSSSSEVYGDPKVFPQRETYTGNVDTLGYRSPYEEGKRFAESLVSTYVRKYKIDIKIARVFNTYGPGMLLSDTRVIPHFISCVLDKKSLPVAGEGTQTRTFCYVSDLTSGLILIMQKGKPGEAYNLGGDEEISILRLAKLFTKLTGVKHRFVKRPAHDHNRRHPDLGKLKSLGFTRKVGLEEGLKKTLKFYGGAV